MSRTIITNIASGAAARLGLGLLALATFPYLVTNLGADKYGLLALGLLIVGYAGLFDLGMANGVIKFVAQYHAANDLDRQGQLISTATAIYTLLGIAAAGSLYAATNLFVVTVFHVSAPLQSAAAGVFHVTALGLLIIFPLTLCQAVLNGYNKQASVNAVLLVLGGLKLISAVVLVHSGYGVISIVTANVWLSVVQLLILILLCSKTIPAGILKFSFDLASAKELLKFCSMVFVAQATALLVTHLDRLIVGIFLTLASVTYYTAAFEVASRLWVIPSILVSSSFPSLTALKTADNVEGVARLYISTSKSVAIPASFCAMFIAVFSGELLTYWVNSEYQTQAATALTLLGLGFLGSCIAWGPGALAIAVGRPDVSAKVLSTMAFVNVVLCLTLVPRFGINGAAVAWLLNQAGLVIFLIPAVNRLVKVDTWRYFVDCHLRPVLLSALLGAAFYFSRATLVRSRADLVRIFVIGGLSYAWLAYLFCLAPADRANVHHLFRARVPAGGKP